MVNRFWQGVSAILLALAGLVTLGCGTGSEAAAITATPPLPATRIAAQSATPEPVMTDIQVATTTDVPPATPFDTPTVTATPWIYLYVQATALRLVAAPGADEQVVDYAAFGEALVLYETQIVGDKYWFKVLNPKSNRFGWASETYLGLEPPPGMPTATRSATMPAPSRRPTLAVEGLPPTPLYTSTPERATPAGAAAFAADGATSPESDDAKSEVTMSQSVIGVVRRNVLLFILFTIGVFAALAKMGVRNLISHIVIEVIANALLTFLLHSLNAILTFFGLNSPF